MFKEYYLEHREDDLINQRLGWLLTSQSILLAGYGLLMSSNLNELKESIDGKRSGKALNHLMELFPIVGGSIAALVLLGVCGAILSFYFQQKKRRKNEQGKSWKIILYEVFGWSPAIGLPIIFLCTWWCLYNFR